MVGPNAILNNAGGGVSVSGNNTTGNMIVGNVLSNSGPGIDLGDDGGANGVTPNTPGGPHAGPNQSLNTPVFTFASGGSLGIALNAASSTTYRIDYYVSAPADPSFGPQAQTYLGQATITTDASGNGFAVVPFTPVAGQPILTATATDPSGNTSELSTAQPDTSPLKAVGVPASFTATQAGTVILAGLGDLDPRVSAGRLSATVDWGDGSAPTPAIVQAAPGGGFVVVGSHSYANRGSFNATVTVTDPILGASATVTSPVSVSPLPILVGGKTYVLVGSKAASFSNVVATFTDAGPALPVKSYSAVVSWGDGTTSVGKITLSRGVFTVKASHRFVRFSGTRNATVTVSDTTGRQAVVTDVFSFRPARGKK